jgi:hypothetical protein
MKLVFRNLHPHFMDGLKREKEYMEKSRGKGGKKKIL